MLFSAFAYQHWRHTQIVGLLQSRQLAKARAELNGYHNWNTLLRMIENAQKPELVQAAFDVQFENWYSPDDDSSYSYPELTNVVRRLLADGATPSYEHLVKATQQNKMQTARLLLNADVLCYQTDAEDNPICNAAYWGDVELIHTLIQHGADINQPAMGGMRPVLAAAWSCRTNCVRFLLEQGADTSLPYEVWQGNTQAIWKVIEGRANGGLGHKAVWEIVCEYKKVELAQ